MQATSPPQKCMEIALEPFDEGYPEYKALLDTDSRAQLLRLFPGVFGRDYRDRSDEKLPGSFAPSFSTFRPVVMACHWLRFSNQSSSHCR